ncbi:MAG: ABC transporter permease [Halolamina sp.]|uniref:ABC transporter permease n=1 Tax=Halolamina sp. TaxID=1940283 RepID=UPI002FC3942C
MATRISFKYLAKRLAVSVLVVWALLTLLFLLLKAMPGDFASLLINPNMEASDIQAVREQWGLNDPLWKQYLKWVGSYAVGDFGYSLQNAEPVTAMVIRRLPRTLVLFMTAFLMQYTIGILIGIDFGWNRGTKVDKSGFTTGLTLYSVPFFWMAWMLLLVLSYPGVGISWFPAAHMTTAFKSQFTMVELVGDILYHLFIPAMSLVVVGWAGAMLVTRTSMQEVLDKQYIYTARAKGLSPTTVKYKHAARNALIPVATQAIVGIAFVIDGSVIVETVFSWPGIGLMLVDAIANRDFPVALASFFMLGVLIVGMRLVTDIVYTYLDPRIKFGESQ